MLTSTSPEHQYKRISLKEIILFSNNRMQCERIKSYKSTIDLPEYIENKVNHYQDLANLSSYKCH